MIVYLGVTPNPIDVQGRTFIDLQLAVTLVAVELPLTAVFSLVLEQFLHTRSEAALEQRRQAIKSVNDDLMGHYKDQVAPAMSDWCSRYLKSKRLRRMVLLGNQSDQARIHK